MRWRRGPGAAVAGCLVLGLLVVAPAALARSDETGGSNLKVQVVGSSAPESTPPATPSASSAPPAQPSSSQSQTGGAATWPATNPPSTNPAPGGSVPATAPPPNGSAAGTPSGATTPGPAEQSIGGLLYVSGLITRYSYSINPFGGSLTIRATVRNVTSQPVDASARFWVTTVFRGRVGREVVMPVSQIAPGETRELLATVRGMGQWALVQAYMTFTPPEAIGDVQLQPMTRSSWVFFLPWAVLLAAVLVGAGLLVRQRVQRTRRAQQRGEGAV